MRKLEEIPKKNVAYEYDKEKGSYVIFMTHTGLNHRIAQKFFKRPKLTRVKVEGLGNDVWELIDGKRSLEKIGEILRQRYGEESEPTYERLLQYIKVLEDNKFIKF